MAGREPMMPVAESYAEPRDPGAPWARALEELDRAETFWLATVHPSGRPHVVPVLAVVVAGAVHVAAGPGTRKARNLAVDAAVTVATHGPSLDLVLEGAALRVEDGGVLAAVAEAYAAKYGWQPRAVDGALHAEGAPTAGPPPYWVYRVVLDRAFGFPTDDGTPPTRWTFRASDRV